MAKMTRLLSNRWAQMLALCCAAFLAFGAADVSAQGREKPKPQTKKVKSVGQWAFKRLSAAHEALAAENYPVALEELQEMRESSRLNEHEEALMWQTYGYIYSAQTKYKLSIDAFEKCVALEGLPESAQVNTLYNLAQLYVVRENYQKAASTFEKWFESAVEPPAEAHYMYAIPLLQLGKKKAALKEAEIAVEKSDSPKEAWLQLVLSLYFENKRYRESTRILEMLVTNFPKKIYWVQLSAVYAELNESNKALAALEVAYVGGLLDQDRELVNLAQLYLFNEVPYKAARVLEKGMKAGVVKPSEKTLELLANAWLSSRDRDKAVSPLKRAAARSKEGQLYLRLAQLQIDQEEWKPAMESLDKAIEKGGLSDEGAAYFLLGIAAASDSQWDEAREAFDAAAEFEDREKSALEWLVHIDQEEAAEAEARAEAEAEAALLDAQAAQEVDGADESVPADQRDALDTDSDEDEVAGYATTPGAG